MHINPRVAATGAPPIPAVQAWMRDYDGAAGPLIDLCQAVPGYPPPPALLDRLAREAADPANARYGAILGDASLRDAYARHLAALYATDVAPGNVAITAGCNQGFFAAVSAVAGPGDAVVLPQPWYFNHEMTLRQLGIEPQPLVCRPERGFVPDAAGLDLLLDRPGAGRVRAVVLVTPNNPTGVVCPAATVAAIAETCRRHGVWLILDETYRDFLPAGQATLHDILAQAPTPTADADAGASLSSAGAAPLPANATPSLPGPAPSPAGAVPPSAGAAPPPASATPTEPWPAHVIQLYSFSKAYAVPGQRLGALAAPLSLMPQLTKILDCLHVCAQRPAQAAIAWAIDGVTAWRDDNRTEMNRRGDILRRGFEQLPDWPVAAQGAYFAYIRHPFRGATGWQVVQHLATRHGIGCLPGSAFGGTDDFLRLAYANVDADGLTALVHRLASVGPPP